MLNNITAKLNTGLVKISYDRSVSSPTQKKTVTHQIYLYTSNWDLAFTYEGGKKNIGALRMRYTELLKRDQDDLKVLRIQFCSKKANRR